MAEAIITLAMLRAKRACKDQRELFQEMFGESVVITEELCEKHAALFSWDWAAGELLSDARYRVYEYESRCAVREYGDKREPLINNRNEALSKIEKVFTNSLQTDADRSVYLDAAYAAHDEYTVADIALVKAIYFPALAKAFAKLFIEECAKIGDI